MSYVVFPILVFLNLAISETSLSQLFVFASLSMNPSILNGKNDTSTLNGFEKRVFENTVYIFSEGSAGSGFRVGQCILTVKHLVKEKGSYIIFQGEKYSHEKKKEIFQVTSDNIITHEEGDLALIKLNTPILKNSISSFELGFKAIDKKENSSVKIFGFGYSKVDWLKLSVEDGPAQRLWGNAVLAKKQLEKKILIEEEVDLKSQTEPEYNFPLYRDSGGPMTFENKVVGIAMTINKTFFADAEPTTLDIMKRIKRVHLLGKYLELSAYSEWITEQLKNNQCEN